MAKRERAGVRGRYLRNWASDHLTHSVSPGRRLPAEGGWFEILEARLVKTKAALRESAEVLNHDRRNTISIREVEGALVDVLGLDAIGNLLDRDIDTRAVLDLLDTYNFARLRPEKLCEIVLADSIIPAGVPVLLTEAEVKLKGQKWVIHKNDADPFPSSPHAHNFEQDLKMHLGTGDMYQRKDRVPCGRMKRALLIEFRERLMQKNATITLPPLAV